MPPLPETQAPDMQGKYNWPEKVVHCMLDCLLAAQHNNVGTGKMFKSAVWEGAARECHKLTT
ncbi:hypothetical protein KEM55_004071 [Ascosphaera atra]|nr:hypothetical protein KEM55_004071 [Ascosphaera atra]